RVGDAFYGGRIRLTPNGQLHLNAIRGAGSSIVALTGDDLPFTMTTTTVLNLRVQVEGTSPTTVRVKAWPSDQPEPTDWFTTTTDGTAALQASGGVGIRTYLGGSLARTFGYDDVWAGPLEAEPRADAPGDPGDEPGDPGDEP